MSDNMKELTESNLNVSIIFKCRCGSESEFNANNLNHKESEEEYVDLTEAVNDNFFKAILTPEGTQIKCMKCQNVYEII